MAAARHRLISFDCFSKIALQCIHIFRHWLPFVHLLDDGRGFPFLHRIDVLGRVPELREEVGAGLSSCLDRNYNGR
jgi:hypothetical protein